MKTEGRKLQRKFAIEMFTWSHSYSQVEDCRALSGRLPEYDLWNDDLILNEFTTRSRNNMTVSFGFLLCFICTSVFLKGTTVKNRKQHRSKETYPERNTPPTLSRHLFTVWSKDSWIGNIYSYKKWISCSLKQPRRCWLHSQQLDTYKVEQRPESRRFDPSLCAQVSSGKTLKPRLPLWLIHDRSLYKWAWIKTRKDLYKHRPFTIYIRKNSSVVLVWIPVRPGSLCVEHVLSVSLACLQLPPTETRDKQVDWRLSMIPEGECDWLLLTPCNPPKGQAI